MKTVFVNSFLTVALSNRNGKVFMGEPFSKKIHHFYALANRVDPDQAAPIRDARSDSSLVCYKYDISML